MDDFINPSQVLNRLELSKDMVACDFGSGSGGWALPLAKQLEKGKVYAIDVLEEPLSALEAKIKAEKISNIKTIRADVERGSTLSDNSCDLVLMTNLLFQAEDVKKVLSEGKRVLKKGGIILAVDWKKTSPFGPEKRISPERVKEIAKAISMEAENEFEAGYHWVLVLKRD